jgi:Ca2+-transporting ATPase
MAHSTANDDGRLALPSINVDVSVSDTTSNSTSANDADMHKPDNNNNEAISPLPTPTTSHAHSPSQLSTPAFGRDRSLSGSTAHTAQSDSPLLKPPHSSGTVSSRASSAFGDEERQDALKPDPGSEKDFTVQDNKFAFSPGQLNKLLNPKSLAAFSALGGIRGIEHGLRTNIDSGLSIDESNLDGSVSFEEAAAYGQKLSNGSSPRDAKANDPASPPANGSTGSFADRIRVFSNNALPEKKAPSLLKLMWMAYNDKILWLLTAAAAISLALGLPSASPSLL